MLTPAELAIEREAWLERRRKREEERTARVAERRERLGGVLVGDRRWGARDDDHEYLPPDPRRG